MIYSTRHIGIFVQIYIELTHAQRAEGSVVHKFCRSPRYSNTVQLEAVTGFVTESEIFPEVKKCMLKTVRLVGAISYSTVLHCF